MRLRYEKADGVHKDIELEDRPLTIGRSADADVMLLDEKVSRVHCGIGVVEDAMVIRDLQSKNGTFVNDERVESTVLNPGDRIRIGSSVFVFEAEGDGGIGPGTALREMEHAFDDGKGYSTILREIVEATGPGAEEAGPGTETAPSKSGKTGPRNRELKVKDKRPSRP
jgi:pSer/pThr/pTyr-binding forkhead associated (FHA) protein